VGGGLQVAGSELRTCILSHGRSGTVYTSLLLQSIGLDFGHERDGKDGTIGGIFFKGKRNLSTYDQVFHQLRHPLDVISSSTTCKESSFNKTFKEIGIGEIREKDPLKRAMLSWYYYTNWAELLSIWRYRIEDFPKVFPELLFRMDVKRVDLPDIPTNVNTRPHRKYTWDDLFTVDEELTSEIINNARRFGYEI
jgi:hypothetical protein